MMSTRRDHRDSTKDRELENKSKKGSGEEKTRNFGPPPGPLPSSLPPPPTPPGPPPPGPLPHPESLHPDRHQTTRQPQPTLVEHGRAHELDARGFFSVSYTEGFFPSGSDVFFRGGPVFATNSFEVSWRKCKLLMTLFSAWRTPMTMESQRRMNFGARSWLRYRQASLDRSG